MEREARILAALSHPNICSHDIAQVGDGHVSGTLPYMAPEQLRGIVDPRSDLFALGVVLYQMLSRHAGPARREMPRERSRNGRFRINNT